jgi:hypothetical protein
MKMFNLFIEEKCTVWRTGEYLIEAETEEEAKAKCIELYSNGSITCDILESSAELIEPTEKDITPTLFMYVDHKEFKNNGLPKYKI